MIDHPSAAWGEGARRRDGGLQQAGGLASQRVHASTEVMIHCRIHFLVELDSLRRYLGEQNLPKIRRVLAQKSRSALLDA